VTTVAAGGGAGNVEAARAAHLANASELVAARRYDEAEQAVLRALTDAPKDLQSLNLLALIRYKVGRLADAHGTYREIAAAAPQDASARRNLGLVALKLGRIDEALPELEMAVRLSPGDERAWSYLGYAYAKKGEVVEAAAAFRRAKQDALAAELEHAATVRRPATPSFHFGHVAQLQQRGADTGVREAAAPRAGGTDVGESVARREGSGGSIPALAPTTGVGRPTKTEGKGAPVLRGGDARDAAEMSGMRAPIALAPPLPPPSAALPAPAQTEVGEKAGALGDPTAKPVEATPVSLLAFVLSRLGQSPVPTLPVGPLRLTVADEIHVRRDAVLAGAGALQWQPGFRRAQGRRGTEPLGANGAFFRLTGAGDIWIAGNRGRWLPLALTEDVLYVREDRVLAFDGQVSWEAGAIPGVDVKLLQFRGRGIVALEVEEAPLAIKVTEPHPILLASARLVGWVGRLVPYGAPLDGAAPFQLACQGEGVVLLDAEGRR
jgi:uncharacterized protein (AIM24 family)